MPYIERKKIKGKYYLYLYETYRVPGGKYPKRRFIRYLGPERHFKDTEICERKGRKTEKKKK